MNSRSPKPVGERLSERGTTVTGMSGRRAVVIGGGICGVAAAVGLSRTGWQVTVLERGSALRETGAGMSLLTNARRCVDWLGVGDAVSDAAATMAPGGEGTRLPSGIRLARPADPEFVRGRQLHTIVLPRPALHGILVDAMTGVTVRTGCEASTVIDHGSSAEVVFGQESLTADLVVAADGMNSRIRRALWPEVPAPTYSGHSVFRGIALDIRDPEPGGSTWGHGREFGRMPLTGDRVYWYAVVNTQPGLRFVDNHAEVLRRFSRWHRPIPALLAATPPESVLYHDVSELATPVESYVKGRTVLLGDAAHAMTSDLGQGACQAFEDAVVLSAIMAADRDIPGALAEYDEQRQPRTRMIVAASRQMGEFKLDERRLRVLVRNIRMRMRSPKANEAGIARLGEWQPPVLTTV